MTQPWLTDICVRIEGYKALDYRLPARYTVVLRSVGDVNELAGGQRATPNRGGIWFQETNDQPTDSTPEV
jgi:hypothetical protein